MKLAALALASLVALATPRVADACEPYQTCGDMFCDRATAVIEADVLSADVTTYGGPVALHIVATYGDMRGLTPGSDITVPNESVFGTDTVGKTLPLLVVHDPDGAPHVSSKLDPSDLPAVGCFDAAATTAEIADIVFSPDCYMTLTPVEPPPPDCPTGIQCNAGSARGGLPLVLMVGLALRRRRRR